MASISVKLAHGSSPAPRKLLLRLSDETRAVNESLKRDLNLLQPDLTLERYRKIVERFYGFYAPWEEAIKPLVTEHLPDFPEPRAKAPMLLEDLNYLGAQAMSLPLCAALPDCLAWPSLLGGLYVTEGATLGGQVTARHAQQMLSLSSRRGTAFFTSYGFQVGYMWRAFCAKLQSHTPAEKEEAVIEAARKTMASMHRWLCG